MAGLMGHTVLAFHAHPDDEALLTSGTLAVAAAAGHRVVLVVATDGGLGPAARRYTAGGRLGAVRLGELQASARAVGAARVAYLGYADSGLSSGATPDPAGRPRFVDVPVAEAAEQLAAILREEEADVLLGYDDAGGYGHPDHVHVARVGTLAAHLARTPRVLQVALSPWVTTVASLGRVRPAAPHVTHRIDVTTQVRAKRAALMAHRSQHTSRWPVVRNLAWLSRLPEPVFRRAVGTERYTDPTLPLGAPVADDIFAGL